MIPSEKATKVLKHWNLEGEPVAAVRRECTKDNNSRAFYVGRDFVLKSSSSLAEVRNAIALCSALRRTNLRVSALIETADGGEYIRDGDLFFYLTQRVSGAPLTAHELYEGDYHAKAMFMGKTIGELHLALRRVSVPVHDGNLYESVENWAMPKAKDVLSLPESFCRDYLNVFGSLYDRLPRQIIHRDANPSNIIVSRGEWGVIDFELSERNLRLYDPCYAASAILSESFDGRNQTMLSKWLEIYRSILWGYNSVVTLSEDERDALPYVIVANQLISTAWFSEQGEKTKLAQLNGSMTQWMISVFDELKLQQL